MFLTKPTSFPCFGPTLSGFYQFLRYGLYRRIFYVVIAGPNTPQFALTRLYTPRTESKCSLFKDQSHSYGHIRSRRWLATQVWGGAESMGWGWNDEGFHIPKIHPQSVNCHEQDSNHESSYLIALRPTMEPTRSPALLITYVWTLVGERHSNTAVLAT